MAFSVGICLLRHYLRSYLLHPSHHHLSCHNSYMSLSNNPLIILGVLIDLQLLLQLVIVIHQEKKKLRPEHLDALDALDVSEATCLPRTQIATAPCVRTQITTVSAYRTERGRAFSFWTHCVRAFSFWTQPCQGIFLLDAVVSGHFPSGCSHVRAFSFLTQLCQGIFLLDAAVSGHFPTGRVRTTYVMAPRLRWLSSYGTSQQILGSHSQTCSRFHAE